MQVFAHFFSFIAVVLCNYLQVTVIKEWKVLNTAKRKHVKKEI